MSRIDPAIVIRQMHEHAKELLAICADKTVTSFQNDRLLNLAATRLLEIIGEGANRLGRTSIDRYPRIPWAEIIALRNRLIHGYDAVDLQIIWNVIQNDIPSLMAELEKVDFS